MLTKPDESWYLINSQWLRRWSDFSHNKGPLPGPIDNWILLEKNGTPKPKLVRSTHYRGVVKEVWDYFHQLYGGGPVICRQVIDIYSRPVVIGKTVAIDSNGDGDISIHAEENHRDDHHKHEQTISGEKNMNNGIKTKKEEDKEDEEDESVTIGQEETCRVPQERRERKKSVESMEE